MKRWLLGSWVVLAAASSFFVRPVQAQADGDAAPAASGSGAPMAGTSMDTDADPTETERSDSGRFSPTGETGGLKADRDVDRDAASAPPRKPINVWGGVLIGFGEAPVPGPGAELHLPSSTLFGLRVGGSYDLTPELSLGLAIAWATASFEGSESAQAFTSPLVSLEYRAPLARLVTLPVGLGVGVPLAQGEADLNSSDTATAKQTQVNTMFDASTGYRELELFAPKRMPIVPFIGLHYERKTLAAWVDERFAILPKLSGEVKSDGGRQGVCCYELKGTALRSSTTVGLGWWALPDKLRVGAEMWAVYSFAEPVEFESSTKAEPPSAFNLLFMPRVATRVAKLEPSIGFMLPVSGVLADRGVKAVDLRVGAGF